MRRRPGIGGLQKAATARDQYRLLGENLEEFARKHKAELLGIGDFYYELGVQIIEVCMITRSHNGGLISLQELCNHLRQRRKKDREAVTEDDCLRAISKLKVLGSGFEVITIGKKKLVRTVPTELNKDHNQMLELALSQGFVIVEEVQRRLSWTSGRVIDALETLLEEGLAMINNGDKDGKCRYWFPCVSFVYSSIGSDT
ncbi:unnamed protein product [Arabidopsis thaliana]|uniref:(thale cress) hypothetical protein n=1 Tax=Arabidopsis thaliana TaxID=3702 RepID=A0A7G2EMP7_ARATH|nr:unnamed protein product [Arabidopsis thaliana]